MTSYDDIEAERIRRKVRGELTGEGHEPVCVGRFELRGWLGKGAMGLVYDAYDPTLDRSVAIKLVDPDVPGEVRAERRARLLREAQALAHVSSDHVVRVFEAGEHHGQVYLAMERLRGRTLLAWVDDESPDPRQIIDVVLAAGRGLAAAHAAGLVHRDFKPDNIVVTDEGIAKVIDFGLVRSSELPSSPVLTHEGTSIGSPAYMSPEQLRGERADTRSDQFAFCATLYEALVGSRPFDGAGNAELIATIVRAEVRPPPAKTVPPGVFALLLRGLSAAPDDRFSSLDTLLAALESALELPALGRRVADRYVLSDAIGKGGMGAVYSAHDERSGETVALKVLPAGCLGDEAAVQRLLREAHAVTKLDHPNIVVVHDAGRTHDGGAYLAMELLRGTTLSARIREGPIALADVERIVKSLAGALQVAHEAGLVHRDVKPDNAMILDDGAVVLLDFGIAKRISSDLDGDTGLTVEGSLIGTPAYLAPEQLRGLVVDARADQFALAVTTYELLIGRRPFTGDTTAVLAQIAADDPEPPSRIRPEIPPAVDQVLARAMSKEPNRRFASIVAFATELSVALRGRRSLGLGRVIALAFAAVTVVAAYTYVSTTSDVALVTDVDSESVVACPVWDVRGDETHWLGAAGADLACRRITWSLGGREERTRTPAELLSLPAIGTTETPPDPYGDPSARPESLERAREVAGRIGVVVDGVVSRRGVHFEVELSTSSHSGESNRATASSEVLVDAVFEAVEALERIGSLPPREPVGDVVARFIAPNGELGADLERLYFTPRAHRAELCERVHAQLRDVGPMALGALSGCVDDDPDGFVLPRHDEVDPRAPEALARTTLLLTDDSDRVGLTPLLARARAGAGSAVERGSLALAGADVYLRVGDTPAQRGLLVAAVENQPRWHEPRSRLYEATAAGVLETDGVARANAAWLPASHRVWKELAWYGVGDDVRTTEMLRRAYVIGRDPETGMHYVLDLLRRRRVDAARTTAGELSAMGANAQLPSAVALGVVDAAIARFASAIERIQDGIERVPRGERPIGHAAALLELRRVAEVVGQEREVADWFVTRVHDDERHRPLRGHGHDMPIIALCLHASRPLAARCLAHMRTILSTDEGLGAFLDGAEHYANGDRSRAVEAWRPLVYSGYYARNLPAAAFDEAGEHDLARRCDAVDLPRPIYNGASRSHPRAALHAERTGDHERARELAQRVIDAWVFADMPVPAVTEMRELLARLDAR